MKSFADIALLPSLQKTLAERGLTKPTEIQARTLPLFLEGESVVGISETGSGKTLAYALPILHHLKHLESVYDAVLDESSPRAVVLVPTRDLGEQVAKVFKTLTHETRLRVRAALGGTPLEQSKRSVAGLFEVLLATPGRLLQLVQAELIHLDDVRILVFDEADQMMDEGFKADSTRIAEACPDELQLALYTATVSPAVQELIDTLFSKANVIQTKGSGKVVESLVTKNMNVIDGKRWPLLEKVLAQKVEGGTILFTNTREQCDRLAKELTDNGFGCSVFRGDMDKTLRRKSLKNFREGKVDLLVATDVAARGLDIERVGRIINYHLPQQLENYLHRAGRTARAGRSGLVVNLVTERDEPLMAKLEGRPERVVPRRTAKSQPQGQARPKPKGRSKIVIKDQRAGSRGGPKKASKGSSVKGPSKGGRPKRLR